MEHVDFTGSEELVDVTTEWQDAQWKEYSEFMAEDGINSAEKIDVIKHAHAVAESGLRVAFGDEVYVVSYSAHATGRMVMSALDRHFAVTHNDFLDAGPEMEVSGCVEYGEGEVREFSYLADGNTSYATRALLEAVGAGRGAVIYRLGNQGHYIVVPSPDNSMNAYDAAKLFWEEGWSTTDS